MMVYFRSSPNSDSMKPIRIKTITDLIKWNLRETQKKIDSKFNSDQVEVRYVFRGVSDSSYPMVPKIARSAKTNKIATAEDAIKRLRLLRDYLHVHLPIYGNSQHLPENLLNKQWMELFIAQHHGAPTSLLDFSRNPLVALYFAVNENPKLDGRVIAIPIKEQPWDGSEVIKADKSFNLISYDVISSQNLSNITPTRSQLWDPYDLKRSLFIAPPIMDSRIQAQIGLFYFFDNSELAIELGTEHSSVKSDSVMNFSISAEKKGDILNELNKIGINSMSLFPDMDGFGKFLTWKLIQ
jgi:hypothetical protein